MRGVCWQGEDAPKSATGQRNPGRVPGTQWTQRLLGLPYPVAPTQRAWE